jgi:hypothetical protein
MQTFQQFLTEADAPSEFVIKIQVRGTDEAFVLCGEQCQWLIREESSVKCQLFKEALSTKKEGEAAYPLRTKACLSAIESLI